MIKFFALLLSLLGLNSCISSLHREEKFLTEAERLELVEYQKEVEIGRNMAGRLLQFYGSYPDDKLNRYVNELGLYLAQFTDAKDRRYIFGILDSKIVNAFACPGGYVLITLGAIQHARDEAELAMLLSHEIAHVAQKHVFSSLQNLDKKILEKPSEIDSVLKSRQRNPGTYSNKTGEDIAEYIAGSAGPGVALVNTAKAGLTLIMEKGLDKKMEFEADEIGLQIAARANYNPHALKNYLMRLDNIKDKEATKIFNSTHPKNSERIAALNSLFKKYNTSEMVTARGESRFLRYTEKLRK